MRAVLFRAFPDPYRQSMRVYADGLQRGLRQILQPGEQVSSYLPPWVCTEPALARYLSQYLHYQLQAPFVQGDVNHVLDHSYAHLLHTVDARRTVVTFHDAIGMAGGWNPARAWNRAALRKAAAVICDSQAGRARFLACVRYPKERTWVVPLGVEARFFETPAGDPRVRLGLPPGRYLLHVGHSKPYKNIPAILRVLSILNREKRLDLRLLRVGTPLTPQQERLARELGVDRQIVQLGPISSERLPEAYRCAELLLFPSLDEGFGLPALEAMASGLPVVASNRGALPEVVGEAGILVDPEDDAAMARQVERVLTETDLRRELQEAGRHRARLFKWEETARQTLQVYRQVQGTPPGAS